VTSPDKRNRRRRGLGPRLERTFLRSHGRARTQKVTLDDDLVMACLLVGGLFLGILVSLTLWQQHQIGVSQDKIKANQQQIARQQKLLSFVEQRDRINSYQAAYRFCTRESIDRAAIHWFLSRRLLAALPPALARAARKQSMSDLRRMEAKDGMPILNCDPNTVGGPAKYEPPAAQRNFVDRWRLHKLTPAEIGICRIRIGALVRPGECLK
jgi:hypothetical protein